ncbi:serine hydrolase [Phenylobacterium sp.]|uniref:serine hydrolase n=1 Tax=Phenylobacterium sp. TaxID=1871053 RepID=UPI003BA98F1D
MAAPDIAAALQAGFAAAGCDGTLHVRDLATGAEVGLEADRPMVPASVFKVLVALEFYARAAEGSIDPAKQTDLRPAVVTPGPTGLSNFQDPVRLSLRDLARQMMTVSDNAATDVLIARVGLDAINARALTCGCRETRIVSDLKAMLDAMAVELEFRTYAELLAAQAGKLGPAAQAGSLDPARLDAVAALDPARGSRTTARDMTTLLASIWADGAALPPACATLREVMGQQVTRRLEPAVPDGGTLAAKSGGLFGRVRNEIGVIGWPDGGRYAVAVFTRAHQPFAGAAAINAEMARAVKLGVEAVRQA